MRAVDAARPSIESSAAFGAMVHVVPRPSYSPPLADWTAALAAAASQVLLVAPGLRSPSKYRGIWRSVGHPVVRDVRRSPRSSADLPSPRISLALSDYAVRGVVVHSGPAVHYARSLARSHNAKLLIVEHYPSALDEDPRRHPCQYESGDMVLAVSPTFAEMLRSRRVPSTPIVSVGNPVDTSRFRYGGARRGRVLRLITAARLVPLKRTEILIEALRDLRRQHLESELTVVGDGPDRSRLESIVERCGLAGCVRFTGWLSRDDLARELDEHHLFVSASEFETFGKSVAEALCSGLPAVVSPIPAHAALVRRMENGLVAPGHDSPSLAAAIGAAWGDRLRPSREIAVAAAAEYGPRVVGRRLAELLERTGEGGAA